MNVCKNLKKLTKVVHQINIKVHPQNIPKDADEATYEMWFVFALVWSFGSALYHDGSSDYKTEFSKWFQTEFHSITNIEFPPFTSVFDLYVDPATQVL